MTKIQKAVFAVGCGVILLLFQFPPYLGILPLEGDNVTRFVGFHYINDPPGANHLSWALYNGKSGWVSEEEYNSEIDLDRLVLHVLTVVVAVCGILLVLRTPKRES